MKNVIIFLGIIFYHLGISCLPVSASPLLGSWHMDESSSSAVLTFLPDGEFIFIQDGDSAVDPTGQDGIERGKYVWNPQTGAFAAEVTLDTNGRWGFSHGIAGVTGITVLVVGDVLTLTIPGEEDVSLARVRGSNPLVGAWWSLDTLESDEGTMAAFLPDGRFYLARDGDTAVDPGGNDGMESGTWSWDSLTGLLTTSVQTDTNGAWGLSHAGTVKTIALHPNGQRLTYSHGVQFSPSTFYRIRPINFSAWASEQGISGNNALQLSKPFANGYENILGYAMNIDADSTSEQHPKTSITERSSGRQLLLDYRLRGGLYGVSLIPQYSSDLVTWTDIPDSLVRKIGMADVETSRMRATVPAISGNCFARLKAMEISITAQPLPTTVFSGETATLTVAVTGSSPATYQWYQGPVGVTSSPLGSNSSSYTTPALTTTTSYWVRVSTPDGSINSAEAAVTVIVAP